MIQQLHRDANQPFSMKLAYYDQLEGTNIELKINMLYNLTCLFSQVEQLEQILLHYNEQEIIVDRQLIVEWYGVETIQFTSESVILKQIQMKLTAGAELPI